MYAQQPQQAAMYPNVAKQAGGGPPSYQAHKKNKYQLADEAKQQEQKQNNYGGGGGNKKGGQTQPKPDARGTCPGLQNFDQHALNKCTDV